MNVINNGRIEILVYQKQRQTLESQYPLSKANETTNKNACHGTRVIDGATPFVKLLAVAEWDFVYCEQLLY